MRCGRQQLRTIKVYMTVCAMMYLRQAHKRVRQNARGEKVTAQNVSQRRGVVRRALQATQGGENARELDGALRDAVWERRIVPCAGSRAVGSLAA